MRPEIQNHVDAVRALGLGRTGRLAPKCVRIAGDPRDFPSRLEVLQAALEAFDASGGVERLN